MSGNEFANYLQQHCTPLGQGKFKGRLYDVGKYPGAVADANTPQYIHGAIYLMDEPGSILRTIDDYEGISPTEPQPHEYVRALIEVEAAHGVVTCWVYLYNWPVNKLAQIVSGDYLQHLVNRADK